MVAISEVSNPWRDNWQQAAYRGAPFFVEAAGKRSGRRIALHEFPKRDTPYAEDMGLSAYIFSITGYLIGPYYVDDRGTLEKALEQNGPGALVLPTRPSIQVSCMRYNVTERRDAGGYAVVEMMFVLSGSNSNSAAQISPGAMAQSNASGAVAAMQSSYNNGGGNSWSSGIGGSPGKTQ